MFGPISPNDKTCAGASSLRPAAFSCDGLNCWTRDVCSLAKSHQLWHPSLFGHNFQRKKVTFTLWNKMWHIKSSIVTHISWHIYTYCIYSCWVAPRPVKSQTLFPVGVPSGTAVVARFGHGQHQPWPVKVSQPTGYSAHWSHNEPPCEVPLRNMLKVTQMVPILARKHGASQQPTTRLLDMCQRNLRFVRFCYEVFPRNLMAYHGLPRSSRLHGLHEDSAKAWRRGKLLGSCSTSFGHTFPVGAENKSKTSETHDQWCK